MQATVCVVVKLVNILLICFMKMYKNYKIIALNYFEKQLDMCIC